MSSLRYSGVSHTLQLFTSNGSVIGHWKAYNNIDHKFAKEHYKSLTHLNDGTYSVQDKSVPFLHKADADGSYGLHGIIRFNYPGHPGVGVHAGRAHAKNMPGPQHATHGCIRTTDDAMLVIIKTMGKDRLQTISIIGNNETSVQHGMARHHQHYALA